MTPSSEAAGSASKTRSQDVFARLREGILLGHIAPGTRLRQVAVAQEYDVSTTPVREAFARLAQEGLVASDGSHRGVVVFQASPQDLDELYEIRIALEPLAARLATPRVSELDIDALQQVIDEMRATDDSATREALNRQFHSQIYRFADRDRLSSIIDQLRDASTVYMRFLSVRWGSLGYRAAADDEHQAIVDALRRRDADAAADTTAAHLEHTRGHILKALSDLAAQA